MDELETGKTGTRKTKIWKIGKLGNWKFGELENWKLRKLENWNSVAN